MRRKDFCSDTFDTKVLSIKLFLWSEMTNHKKVSENSDPSADQPVWSTKKLSHLFEVLFLLAACQISDDDDPDKKGPQCCCGQFLLFFPSLLYGTHQMWLMWRRNTSVHSLISQNSPSIPGFLLFLKMTWEERYEISAFIHNYGVMVICVTFWWLMVLLE